MLCSRYWAIHDPINYATKRTEGRVYLMILLVWLVSCIICLPPLIGWNDWPEHFTSSTPCMLTEEKGYIVYSSLGRFIQGVSKRKHSKDLTLISNLLSQNQ